MLEFPSKSDYDEMNTGASKSSNFEPTKKLMKTTRLGCRSQRKFVGRVHNIRVKISIMEIFTLKAMIGRSRRNTTTKPLR